MFLLNLIISGFFCIIAWNTSVEAFATNRPIWGWFSLIVSAVNGAAFAIQIWGNS